MTNRPALLRQIYTEARPYVEQLVELNVAFTGFRKLATDNGLDWGQIKALLRAEIEDGEEGGSEKVDRIIKKAEFAGEYAALLGLGSANMNEWNSNSSSSQDGVAVTRPVRPVVDVASGEAAFTVSPSLPPHDEDGVIIEPATIIVAAGEAGPRTSSCPQAGLTVSPTLSEPASALSDAEAGQEDGAERPVGEEPGPKTSSVAPPSIPEPATAPPKAVAAAPVELSPFPDNAPGAPITGEMPDIPKFLDRREKAA